MPRDVLGAWVSSVTIKLVSQSSYVYYQRFFKCGPWISSITSPRNMKEIDFQAWPQPYWTKNSGVVFQGERCVGCGGTGVFKDRYCWSLWTRAAKYSGTGCTLHNWRRCNSRRVGWECCLLGLCRAKPAYQTWQPLKQWETHREVLTEGRHNQPGLGKGAGGTGVT